MSCSDAIGDECAVDNDSFGNDFVGDDSVDSGCVDFFDWGLYTSDEFSCPDDDTVKAIAEAKLDKLSVKLSTRISSSCFKKPTLINGIDNKAIENNNNFCFSVQKRFIPVKNSSHHYLYCVLFKSIHSFPIILM